MRAGSDGRQDRRIRVSKLPVERASGLRRINDNDAQGVTTSAAAAGFAAEGMLRSTHLKPSDESGVAGRRRLSPGRHATPFGTCGLKLDERIGGTTTAANRSRRQAAMRNGQNKRMRGRNRNHKSHHSGGGGGGGGGHHHNPLTRVYESNGPEVKIRGTAHHIAEKYLQLARDAQSVRRPGDRREPLPARRALFPPDRRGAGAVPAAESVLPGAARTGQNDSRRRLRRRRGRRRPAGARQPIRASRSSGSSSSRRTSAAAELQQQPAAELSAARAAAALWRPAAELSAARRSSQQPTATIRSRRSNRSRRRRRRATASVCRRSSPAAQPQQAGGQSAAPERPRRQQPGRRPLPAAPPRRHRGRAVRDRSWPGAADFGGDGPEPGNS